jgi:hypothetical protein
MKKDPHGSFFFLAHQVRGRDAENLLWEAGLIGQFKKQLTRRMHGAMSGFQSHRHRHQNGLQLCEGRRHIWMT